MYRVPRLLSHAFLVTAVAAMLLLGACSSGVKNEAAMQSVEKKIDLKVKAYKSGQFLLDGAVLSPLDLQGHFAYLKDQHRLPKSVLLVRSDESKVSKGHLLSMARMELDFGFAVFYQANGKLRRIQVTDKRDVPALRDESQKAKLPDRTKGKEASDPGSYTQYPQQGY